MPSFIYCIPVLVTAGSIFTVDVIEDQTPAVAPVSWAPLIRQFSEGPFLMDVVTYDAIEEYVEKRVYPIHDDIEQALRAKINLFNPEWLRREYGEPADPKLIASLEGVSVAFLNMRAASDVSDGQPSEVYCG